MIIRKLFYFIWNKLKKLVFFLVLVLELLEIKTLCKLFFIKDLFVIIIKMDRRKKSKRLKKERLCGERENNKNLRWN